ncbi:ArpU family phage packaging/lysis transcriptional regulator [Paenibacillus sp. MMO-58]|uniref:ArpU family phage packaging/lysis transcriptional regulator n=1 Tax=Paenibacillus sp. MMO-58 TaxID=3081290 RepID=UPI003017124E
MQQQLSFDLPDLDGKKTKAKIEDIFDKYRIFKMLDFEEREATTTQSYSDMPTGKGTVSDQTANIAIYNVDEPESRRAFMERVERAVKRLHPQERLLIEERYMKEDYVFDFVVFNQKFNPAISREKYKKLREAAFYKLALAFRLDVKKE